MIYNNFENNFGEWASKFKKFIESKEMDSIYKSLKEEGSKNKTICPASKDTYRIFSLIKPEDVKVIWWLQDPYDKLLKDNRILANGVAMSCENNAPHIQPSLEQFYHAAEREMYEGMNLKYFKNPSLQYLIDQGIMFMNSSLTVEAHKSGSHRAIWEPFMKYFIEEVLNKYTKGLIIVMSGAESQKLEKYFNPLQYYIIKNSHPASASYKGLDWNSEGAFAKINQILEANNGKEFKINWLDEEPPF